jgi:hypothetical protein
MPFYDINLPNMYITYAVVLYIKEVKVRGLSYSSKFIYFVYLALCSKPSLLYISIYTLTRCVVTNSTPHALAGVLFDIY